MLNIISRSLISKHNRGPRKVVKNLLRGLDQINCPYVTNAAPDATTLIWIHDDPEAFKAAVKLTKPPLILAGPNIYTLPSQLPPFSASFPLVWLHPAPWVQKFWETFQNQKLRSVVWPVGIDTKTFAPTNSISKDLVLVYNKQRTVADTKKVCEALSLLGEQFQVLTYGNYQEAEYQSLLSRAKALVWVGRSESQGIALLEALSMNVPTLVWDVEKFGQWEGQGRTFFSAEQLNFSPVTSAPYFNETCGVKFTQDTELDERLKEFLGHLPTFSPRLYIENNLSLQKQAESFLEIFKTELGATEKLFKDNTLFSPKRWKNDTLTFKLGTQIKDVIRKIIR